MFSSTAQQEFKKTLKEFAACKEAEYSHAFTAGYFESMCVDMFGQLTKKQQKIFQASMQRSVQQALQHLNAALANTIKESA
jgi:enamine deaminase RidA (YjgF/YER057c/UK114 family)